MEIYWNDKGEKKVNNLTSSSDTLKRDVKQTEQNVDFDLIIDEAWKLHLKNHNTEALNLIDFVLKLQSDENYYNVKAVIYDKLSQFEEADKCYDEALKINPHNHVIRQNKVEMLYSWAKQLWLYPTNNKDALKIINNAINNLDDTIDDNKFWDLKSKILSRMKKPIEAHKCELKSKHQYDKLNKFENKLEYLETTDDILINVTGIYFYKGITLFKKGLILDLIPEPENEVDSDAIKVELNGEKVGYVANSPNTLIKYAQSATDIKDKIENNHKAEVQFIFLDRYVIAKLISKSQNELLNEIESHNNDVEKFLSDMDEVIKSVKDY